MIDAIELSDEQRTILQRPLAPLRIVAGAGTGKTTTIALRLAAAVGDEGIEPEEALGITFTNKAAEELADRLRIWLPEPAAEGREVEVTTYHGFAHRLLQEFGAFVGVERDAQIVGPGYTRQLMSEALGEATLETLDLTAPAHRVNEAVALSRQLGDNLLKAEEVIAAKPDHTTEVWRKRKELASILVAYETTKRRLGVVDYADLIRGAHRLVAGYADIAQRIRDRYRLVVLDEYQDTDPGQRELLRVLFGEGFPVIAVGDPNQTIYEWRGASLENFASFPYHFPLRNGSPANTEPLTVNRRSGQAILAVANRIRREIASSTPTDDLRPVDGALAGWVEARYFRTAWEEAAWIASEIRRLHDEEGRKWRDLAILFRKNRNIAMVRDAMDMEGIPLEVVSLGGLLAVPEVAELHAWLRILHDPGDSAALARILLGGRYRLGFGDLAPLARWVEATGAASELPEEAPGWPLLEAVDRLEEIEGLSQTARSRLESFRARYRHLLTAAQSSSLLETCRRVLEGVGAWTEVDAMEGAAGLSARLNLYRFLDLAEDWSPLQERPSLEAFLGYLEVLRSEDDTEELDTARVSEEDAVSLLTVHRAKGLEWNTVFLPAVTHGTFPARSLGFDNPLEKPHSLPYELRLDASSLPDLSGGEKEQKEALRARHLDQEWRTAYVAVTRAKAQLYLSGAWWYTSKQERRPSALFDLVGRLGEVDVVSVAAEAGAAPQWAIPLRHDAAPDPLFVDGWKTALRHARLDLGWIEEAYELGADFDEAHHQMTLALEELPAPPPSPADPLFTASVTGLVTMAGCPLRFYWSELDRLPRRPDTARKRGSDFHRRAELHNLGVAALPQADAHALDPEAMEKAETASRSAWETFLSSRFAESRPRFVEVPVQLHFAEGTLRGRVDAIYEEEPGIWEIVDYKSGRRRDDLAGKVQLAAYAVAAAEGAVADPPPSRVRVTFAYFGSGEAEEQSEVADKEWLDAARGQLNALFSQAANGPYPPSPSTACAGCDFLPFCAEGKAFLEEG